MSDPIKRAVRQLTPAAWRRWWRQRFGWRWFAGEHANWSEALRAAEGYAAARHVERAVNAARAVRAGQAAWERDGTLFAEPQAHEPLLAALRRVAAGAGGRLRVVDFGGSLGSTWWQHRGWLAGLAAVDWRVVEQPALVEAGRREFEDETLRFFASMEDAWADGEPDVVLFSSVLQYVEAPRAVLAEARWRGCRHMIVDRAACARDGRERIVLQRTPPRHGGGSYPCRLFDARTLAGTFRPDFAFEAEWLVAFDEVDADVVFRGWHFQRRGTSVAGEMRKT